MNNSYLRKIDSKDVEIFDENNKATSTVYTDELESRLELENVIETLENQISKLNDIELPQKKIERRKNKILLALSFVGMIILGIAFKSSVSQMKTLEIVLEASLAMLGTISIITVGDTLTDIKENIKDILNQIKIKKELLPKYEKDLKMVKEREQKAIEMQSKNKNSSSSTQTNPYEYSYTRNITIPAHADEEYIEIPRQEVNSYKRNLSR